MAENIPTRHRTGRGVTDDLPEPPTHLSEEAVAIWDEVVRAYVLDGPALLLLRGDLEHWDQYQAARAALAKDGPTVTTGDGGMVRQHPAAKVAKDAFGQFRAAFRQLGLEPPK